jgi:hypothetical protein
MAASQYSLDDLIGRVLSAASSAGEFNRSFKLADLEHRKKLAEMQYGSGNYTDRAAAMEHGPQGSWDRRISADAPGKASVAAHYNALTTGATQLNEYDKGMIPDRRRGEIAALNTGIQKGIDSSRIAGLALPKPAEAPFDPYYQPSSPGYNRVEFPKRKPSFLFSPLAEYLGGR